MKPGCRRRFRIAYAASCQRLSSHGQIHTPRESSRASVMFPSRRRAAGRQRPAPHAAPFEIPLRHRAMELDLFGEIALELPLSDDVPHTTKQLSHADL